jgi:hypothetical protein
VGADLSREAFAASIARIIQLCIKAVVTLKPRPGIGEGLLSFSFGSCESDFRRATAAVVAVTASSL